MCPAQKAGHFFYAITDSMTVAELAQYLEDWAPKWSAWERDNVGLQMGDRRKKVRSVLLTLDITESVAQEAISRRADLIVSHHPLLFRPLTTVTSQDTIGRIVLSLAKKDIAVYSAHTNLDFTTDGVSFVLARTLGLRRVRFLAPLRETLAKIVVFVPESHVEAVTSAMAGAGGGTIGEYSSCSFRSRGRGTFIGSEQTNPYAGKAGTLEQVDEIRLEMVVPRENVRDVVRAVKEVHPYEEVAYDIYHVENENPNFGMGAVGELPAAKSLKSFLALISRKLGAPSLRHTGELSREVRRIAVCGGSGSELLATARNNGADALVTADVRYHTFHEVDEKIALIDAGHWETERLVLESVADRLRQYSKARRQPLTVYLSKTNTNPIRSFCIDGRR